MRHSRGFRWLYAGQVSVQLSRLTLVVAVPYQVFVISESVVLVGLVGLVQIPSLIVCSILGGAAADAMDRRRILVVLQLLMGVTSAALAINTAAAAALWPIFVLVAINAGLSGAEAPARTAIIPSLIDRDQLPAAFALNQTLNQTAHLVIPAAAGALIAGAGLEATYWVSAVACVFTSAALLPIGSQRAEGGGQRMSLGSIVEGWRYLRGVPLLQQVMLVDLNAMVFGLPRALFPVIGLVSLGGDAATVGLLHAAPGAGALIGALTTGWVSSVRRQGRVVVCAVGVYGLAIVGFGFTRTLVTAMAFLAVAGAADVVSNVFRNAILQMAVPDELRGRISAFKVALSGGGPRLGDAESGAVAELTTPTFSVVSGGLASIAGTLLVAVRGRALWEQSTLTSLPPEPAEEALPDPPPT